MKKLILLLLFIPLVSFGQITYKDLMKLDSQDAFEKLMFDKRFSAIKEVSEGTRTYALDPDYEDKSKAFAMYFTEGTEFFYFQFVKPDELSESFGYATNIYEEILNKVERKCKFVKMYKVAKDNYACYDCKQAEFIGLLGFTVADGMQHISQLPYAHILDSK